MAGFFFGCGGGGGELVRLEGGEIVFEGFEDSEWVGVFCFVCLLRFGAILLFVTFLLVAFGTLGVAVLLPFIFLILALEDVLLDRVDLDSRSSILSWRSESSSSDDLTNWYESVV